MLQRPGPSPTLPPWPPRTPLPRGSSHYRSPSELLFPCRDAALVSSRLISEQLSPWPPWGEVPPSFFGKQGQCCLFPAAPRPAALGQSLEGNRQWATVRGHRSTGLWSSGNSERAHGPGGRAGYPPPSMRPALIQAFPLSPSETAAEGASSCVCGKGVPFEVGCGADRAWGHTGGLGPREGARTGRRSWEQGSWRHLWALRSTAGDPPPHGPNSGCTLLNQNTSYSKAGQRCHDD